MEKITIKRLTAFILILAALIAAAVFSVVFVNFSAGTAYAAEGAAEYIKAPVSDLERNSVAGVSTLPLRNDINDEIVFYVPESYYVTIEGHSPLGFYTVSYMDFSTKFHIFDTDLNGLSPASVTFDTSVSPYPSLLLNIADGEEIVINNIKMTSESGYTIKYVGGTDKTDYIYVKADKDDTHYRGAVEKSKFNSFAVPYHSVSEAERNAILESKNPGNSATTPAPTTNNTLRIIIIIGIAVPAVIIVFLIFKPSKNKGNNYDKRVMKGNSRSSSARSVDYDRDRSYFNKRDNYDERYSDNRYDNPRYNSRDNYSGRDYNENRNQRGYDDDRYRNRNDRYDDRDGYDGRDHRYDDRDRR